jgi:hypothetical protein
MDKEGKKGDVAFWLPAALIPALVAYALSYGPACWWTVHGKPLPVPVEIMIGSAYEPLEWFCRTTGTFHILQWYVELWAGPIPKLW